jgi:hypothetical protein
LVEQRHTRSLGQRLHYAQLADPAPPLEQPADRDGLTYSADLLTLADNPAPDTAAPDTEESR